MKCCQFPMPVLCTLWWWWCHTRLVLASAATLLLAQLHLSSFLVSVSVVRLCLFLIVFIFLVFDHILPFLVIFFLILPLSGSSSSISEKAPRRSGLTHGIQQTLKSRCPVVRQYRVGVGVWVGRMSGLAGPGKPISRVEDPLTGPCL